VTLGAKNLSSVSEKLHRYSNALGVSLSKCPAFIPFCLIINWTSVESGKAPRGTNVAAFAGSHIRGESGRAGRSDVSHICQANLGIIFRKTLGTGISPFLGDQQLILGGRCGCRMMLASSFGPGSPPTIRAHNFRLGLLAPVHRRCLVGYPVHRCCSVGWLECKISPSQENLVYAQWQLSPQVAGEGILWGTVAGRGAGWKAAGSGSLPVPQKPSSICQVYTIFVQPFLEEKIWGYLGNELIRWQRRGIY